jgi:hypothetical protein
MASQPQRLELRFTGPSHRMKGVQQEVLMMEMEGVQAPQIDCITHVFSIPCFMWYGSLN